ncbi:MAG: hypothetical protein JWM61_1791 [Micrococcaceae bacterium]|nr:hypothetical protein [Micrococcaceae bacterium]
METGATGLSADAPVSAEVLRAPSKARRVRATALGGAGVLIVLIAGFVTVNVVNTSAFGPHRPVEAYLDALVAGDADLSRTLISSGVGGDEDALLSDAVYGEAGGRLSGYEVQDVSTTDGTATVTADVVQGGLTTSVDFTLTRTGRAALLFDEWRLDGPEPVRDISMVVAEDLQAVTVNGAEVALPSGGTGPYAGLRSVALPALPGDYVVSPPAPSTYQSYGDEQRITVSVDADSAPSGVLFRAEATPAAESEAIARVTERLDACLASTEPAPGGCPNRSFMFGDPEDVRDPRWTLDREPTFLFEESYEPGVYGLRSVDAEATFSYERNTEFDRTKPPRWERAEDTQTLLISATVTVTGEELQVELD